MNHHELLIGGHFIGGPCDYLIPKHVVIDPWSGSVVGTTAEATEPEIEAALHAASKAWRSWRDAPAEQRAGLLARVSESLFERREEFAELMVKEIGKPITLALGEVDRAVLTLQLCSDWVLASGMSDLDVTSDPRSKDFEVSHRLVPVGAVLAVTPYNWPINLAAHKIGPALALGASVILKGSPFASLSTLAFARLFHEAGCPAGVLNAVVTDDHLASKMGADPRIAVISFTGSPKVGSMLKANHPKKRVVLELGGNAYAVITPTADLELAAKECALSAFAYAGQICISLQNLLVHQSIVEEFRGRFLDEVAKIKSGDPHDPATVCGPLIHVEAAERIRGLLKSAEGSGIEVKTYGQDKGNFVAPSVVFNPPRDHALVQEEVFGPVVTVGSYSDLKNAIDEINTSSYGIHASIYSSDPDECFAFHQMVEIGATLENAPPSLRFDAMPYGGRRESGDAREGIPFGMQELGTIQARIRRISKQ